MKTIDIPELNHGNSHIFLQSIDSLSGVAVRELYLGQLPDATLKDEIGCDLEKLSSNDITYIDNKDLLKVKKLLKIEDQDILLLDSEKDNEDIELAFQVWNPNKSLPYRIHTNRELILMLNDTKPLSVFVGRIPPEKDFVEVPEHIFDPYVESGYLVKREIEELSPYAARGIQGHRVVLYARSGEEWRLNAYLIVRGVGNKIGWSEPLTRLEGILLGYAEWQNDAFIASMATKKAKSLPL